VGAADACLEHAATPDWQALLAAKVMNRFGHRQTPNPPRLDVHDPSAAQSQRCPCGCQGGHALIQADGRPQALLQLRMVHQVVVGQGLLDHHQVKLVQSDQFFGIGQGVGRIGIDHERQAGEPLAHLAHDAQIPSRFDLDLDAAVALGLEYSDALQ